MRRVTNKEIIERFNKVHGNKYDYSKVEYVNMSTKVCIICPEHGEFWQIPINHLKGCGCPKCSGNNNKTTEEFISQLKKKYPNIIFDKVKYINNLTPVTLVCPEHGEFTRLPTSLLKSLECPICQKNRLSNKFTMSKDRFIELCKEKHGNKYDYSKVEYVNNHTKVCIICPEHGEFWQNPLQHIKGGNCPICSTYIAWDKRGRITNEEFIKRCKEVHGDKYDYSTTQYNGGHNKVKIICKKHGEFSQDAYAHLNGQGCPVCGREYTHSSNEIEMFEFIKSILPNENVIIGDRNLLSPLELDIYIPSKNIAFEYNGLYWHSELKVDYNYHLNKTILCNKKNIRLIHIFEDEWIYSKEIVKSRIKSILGLELKRISASKCKIHEITSKECKQFLTDNHIQGACQSLHQYGLFYKDEMVSVMCFGHLRKNLNNKGGENDYELLRFCNKLNTKVIGGASKLLTHFIRDYKPETILSFADRRWSNGDLYEKLGFKWLRDSKPSYFYIVNNKRENRFKYRKSELVKQGFDRDLSEHNIMKNRHIYRIYDCGTKVYKKIIE